MKLFITIFSLIIHCHGSNVVHHYNDFCGVDDMTVVFGGISAGECVCFETGSYTHISKSCQKQEFQVPSKLCAQLPYSTKSISKLNIIPNVNLDHIYDHFDECNEQIHMRVRRNATGGGGNGSMDAMDEDFSATGTEIGLEMMRSQMNQYIESVIAKLTGLQGEGGSTGGMGPGGRHKYPVIKLMDYTKQIMQKTCTVVNADFFDLALNSFINLQLETYHIKEPYIGYSAYKRIEQAMTRCLQRASPHVFVTPDKNSTSGPEMCDNHVPNKSSNKTVIHSGTEDEEIKNITIPPYASSELEPGKIAEPLIESVWKMLVSAHSYCYMYFSDYFNDHHTYTVALLPLFTNEIQDVWLNEANGTKGYDLSDPNKHKLYGGLLGDVIQVLRDVDYCVGASRAVSPYPWFMNRPLRDTSNGWNKRKKREATDEHAVTEKLESRVRGGVLSHECKESVNFADECVDVAL